MGKIDTYHKWLEEASPFLDASRGYSTADSQELGQITEQIREVPTKVGLALFGLRMSVIAIVLVFSFFVLLRIFALPKFDYIVEKRLGDHYRTQFSEPLPSEDGIVPARNFLSLPLATDLDQDEQYIYLATRGHGIQALHKDDALWTTHDAKSTQQELPNDVKAIHRQHKKNDERLWALGFNGSITLGSLKGNDIDFRALYAAGAWRYVTADDISATLLVDDRYFVMGTSTKGAGIYDTHDHQWLDIKEIRGHNVKKILYEGELLWFLTDHGIYVYKIVGRKEGSNRLICRFLPTVSLNVPDLIDIKVYASSHALAITSDLGCYLLHGKWSDKLLGGTNVLGLTQDAIKFSLFWHDRIIVIGETFGIAAYDPVQRDWSVIKQGPLPALNSFDHDDAHIVIASANGVHVVQKNEGENFFHYFEKMSETDVSKVSLFEGGFLYLVRRNDSTGSDAGWMNFKDHRLTLVTDHDTKIQVQPKITDVVLVDNHFWIGTLGHGVLRYDIHNRRVTQVSGTKAGTLITNVRKVGCFGNDLLMLANEHIYRWDKENQHWVSYLEGIADFRVDPSGQRLWRCTTGGEIIDREGEKDITTWFSGQGPASLDAASASGVFVLSAGGIGPQILFQGTGSQNRVLFPYSIGRANWGKPRTIAGTHSVAMFAPLGDHIFSLDGNGSIFDDDRKVYGQGAPKNDLNAILLVRQQKENRSIKLYGPGGLDVYHPDQGRWEYQRYDFLGEGETVDRLFHNVNLSGAGGQLAETSLNRLFFIDEEWQTAIKIDGEYSDSQFDGHSIWTISRGRLQRHMLKRSVEQKKAKITIDPSTYFSGWPSDLSSILEAWHEDKELHLATSNNLYTYNTQTHSWEQKPLLGGQAVEIRRIDQQLYVVEQNGYRTHTLPKLDGTFVTFPAGSVKKVDFDHNTTVATFGNGSNRKVYLRKPKEWKALSGRRSRFRGRLDTVTAIFKTSKDQAVWVYTPEGVIGRYSDGNWSDYSLPAGFTFGSFWQGPADHLYVIGSRTGQDHTTLPVLFFDGNGFRPLKNLPAKVKAAGREKGRYLWLKDDNGDPFVLDLQHPNQEGFNLTEICLTAPSKLTTSYYFHLGLKSYAKALIGHRGADFSAALAMEAFNDIQVLRDADGNAKNLFLTTPRGIYCFERMDGMWFLTAEYRVYGQIPLKESLGLALACENQRESSDAFIRQANVRISVASGGQNPIAALIGNRLSTSGYKEASLDIFGQITNPKTVSQGSLSIEVRDEGGIDLRADLGSAGRVTIPHDNGRFETDAEFIDAAVDASGKWWILRNNSLTCYKSDALMEIVDFGLFNTKVNSDAVLRFFENTLVIGTSGTYAAVVIRNAGVVSTPYQKEVTVNTDTVRDTGLQVVKDLQGARIKIGDAVYTGGRPFPFDTLDAMVATEGKIFLKTPVGIWTFTTGQSELGRGRYLPFPQTLQGPKILKACPAESAVLKVGNRLHRISSDFPELPSEDCIRPPRKVADENGWQWYFDADHQRVLFKARVGGQWKEYTRQSADGRFADDISSFMVSFDGAVHVATKMGILRFELKKGDSDQTEVSTEKTIVIEGVRELKTVEGALYALTQDSKVLKLNVKEQWEPDGGASATAIFEKATPVYSSPYLTIAAFRNRLKITAESGRSAVWDGSAKRFRMDMVQDFAVGKESLVVLNRQSKGAVRHSFEDLHRHYLPADQPLMGFETRDGNIYALTTAKTFLMDHDRSGDSPAWKPVSSNLVLAGRNGLSFRKDLLATVEDNAILPFLADKRMDAFWSQGRFAFDLITNIEGGGDSAWWTTTAAGLVTMQGLEGMQLNTLHADIPATARLKHRKGHLYIAIEEAHYHLDAEAMKIEPAPATEMTAFSRVVFDFRIDPDNRYYTWAPVEIEDREQRAVFQVLTGDAVRRSDVLAGGRFFWDQVISAAHDPEQGLYWTIGPGHLSTNRFHRVHQRPTLSPTGFFFEASALEGYDIKDTVFKDGTLYVLHTSTPAQSVGSEQPAPDSDVDDPVMNEPVELVRKRVDNQEWRHADDEEYPFWQPMVEFSLEDHIWTQKRLRYSRFHSRESNFSFTAPRDYPLFSRFGRGSEYGKFSFDYLTSIYAVDDTLWAGSRGGLVKLRCRVDNQKHALRLEQLYLPQSSLHDSVQAKPLYNVSAMRVETPQRKLHLLVQSADNSRFVQALDLPGWEKVDPLKTPKETMDLPISGGFKYHLTYDPVRDVGSIDLVGDGDETITLCHYRSFTPCENRLDVSDDGRLVFRADDDAYGFILPQGASNTISVPLSAVDMVEPRSRFQVLVTGDSIGKLEWGVVDDHTPAVRLPSGNILILTGSPGLDALKIEGSTLVWRPKSEKAGSQNIIAKHLNLKTGRLTSVDGTSDAVQWVAYTTQPGDSISQYLIDYGIVEKRNFFRKLFNRKHIELKHWIDLIAKKNKIHWGGKGDYDYPLQVGSVYMMPQKGVDLDSAYRTDIENLVIGKERFDRWGDEQRPASGLVISEIVRIGFGHGQFMVFNIDSRQAIFHPLPTQLPPLRLWQTGSRVLMSFTDGEDLELWQYFPQNLRTADSDPDNFHVIRVRNGSQVLEAHPKAGIIVDNGFDRKHVIKSSEAFFGTHMDKVVDIVEDNRGHGYWFATETSGLIWSRQPF